MQTLHGCPWCTFQIINGACASLTQLRLGEGLKRLLNTEIRVNEKVEGISVDLVLIFQGRLLCVFYDSSTWHTIPSAKERDETQTLILTNAGFWVLRVLSDTNLPSKKALEEALSEFSDKNFLVILTLADWGVRPGFHERSRDYPKSQT